MKTQTNVTIAGATTPSDLAHVVRSQGGYLGQKLSNVISKLKLNNRLMIFLGIAAIAAITATVYLSYHGIGFIFGSGGVFSMLIGGLDAIVIALLIFSEFKGWKSVLLIGFEIATLTFMGYTIGGYFGGGSLQSVVNERMTELYDQGRKGSYNDADALVQLMNSVKSDAAAVEQAELTRKNQTDPEGPVYEKSVIIQKFQIDELSDFPTPAKAPKFTDLPDANQWLQGEVTSLNSVMQKYQSVSEALKSKAQGAADDIQSTINSPTTKLSEKQIGNLRLLQNGLQQVAKRELNHAEIKADGLTANDFRADGFQKYMGFLFEIVVVGISFFILWLKRDVMNYDMAELRSEAEDVMKKLSFENTLQKHSIHLPGTVNPSDPHVARFIANLERDERFKEYVSLQNGSLEDVIGIYQKSPEVAQALSDSSWKISDISKLMENPEMEGLVLEAIQVPPAEWNKLIKWVSVEQAIAIGNNPESGKHFAEIMSVLSGAARFENGEIKKFFERLLINQPTSDYLETLLYLCNKLNRKKIEMLDRGFILLLSPRIAKIIIPALGDSPKFEGVVRGFEREDVERFRTLFEHHIDEDHEFSLLMKHIFMGGGLDAFRRLCAALEQAVEDQSESMTGGRKIEISAVKLAEMHSAAVRQKPDEFNKVIPDVFVLGSVTTV